MQKRLNRVMVAGGVLAGAVIGASVGGKLVYFLIPQTRGRRLADIQNLRRKRAGEADSQ